MSDAVLFAVFDSSVPVAGVTEAVFTIGPVASALTNPVIVTVTVLTAPGATLAFGKLTVLPDVASGPHDPRPTTLQLAVTPTIEAGITSLIVKPLAREGPAFVATIVYVTAAPGTYVTRPFVMVTARSTCGTFAVSMSVAVLFPRSESL